MPQNIYFGDLHVHSVLSIDSSADIDSLYFHARYDAGLDFICISDHDILSGSGKWLTAKQKANGYYEPGKFVSLIGYEYTRFGFGGHKIVYYDSEDAPRFSAVEYNELALFDSIKKHNGLIHIAHPDNGLMPSNQSYFDNGVIRNIEVFGSTNQLRHEYFGNPNAPPIQSRGLSVQDWLNSQKFLGLMGVSDAHNGNLLQKSLTAVITDSLNRKEIIRAIKKRHVYAVTNGQKILLSFSSNGSLMGDSVNHSAGNPKSFYLNCTGTDEIALVEIIKNGGLLRTYNPNNINFECQFTDTDSLYYSYYYLRLTQSDGSMAISSPIFFIQENGTTPEPAKEKTAANFLLYKNYPNPFNSITNIMYEIYERGFAVIKLYNVLGQEIDVLLDEYKNKGLYKISCDASRLTSGIYFYELTLTTNDGISKDIQKMMLVR